MTLAPVGIIGFGAIARGLIATVAKARPGIRFALLVRPTGLDAARAEGVTLAREAGVSVQVTDSLAALLAEAPRVVAECAGHGAVSAYGPQILAAGTDLIVASVGALANPEIEADLRAAARQGGAQVTVPAGAIGGIDVLAAARLSGLRQVIYTGRKPPHAWAGSPAEAAIDLGAVTQEVMFFEGSAREAARTYPKNANVAATLALAGLGMDRTQVRLVADPTVAANIHEYHVDSAAVGYTMRLEGRATADNPKTSQATYLSIARAVLNRSEAIVI